MYSMHIQLPSEWSQLKVFIHRSLFLLTSQYEKELFNGPMVVIGDIHVAKFKWAFEVLSVSVELWPLFQ